MTKVSIVGVEGSGKTVLMAVLGDKYKLPDANGLSLKPNNFETYSYVESQMAALQESSWPQATTPDVMQTLGWTLQRTDAEGNVTPLGEVPFLDFAGEVYRYAFGPYTEEEVKATPNGDLSAPVRHLREHVKSSQCLVVLVNLTHVINGSKADRRTQETAWLTQRIVEFAKEAGIPRVAIALTQCDRYRAEIEACGGVSGTLQKYLPHVATSFPHLDVFEVAAVGEVKPSATGAAVPYEGSDSIGIEDLMSFMAGSVSTSSRVRTGGIAWLALVTVLIGAGVWGCVEFQLWRENDEWRYTKLSQELNEAREQVAAADKQVSAVTKKSKESEKKIASLEYNLAEAREKVLVAERHRKTAETKVLALEKTDSALRVLTNNLTTSVAVAERIAISEGEKFKSAEQRAVNAEERAAMAENRANAVEKKVVELEKKLRVSEKTSVVASSTGKAAEKVDLLQHAVCDSRRLYKIIDLHSGETSYLDREPEGGWTSEYKTNKLVLRRIEAGSFLMGSPTGEVGRSEDEVLHRVRLTKSYYIGVFEVTRAQWDLIGGRSLGRPQSSLEPVRGVTYEDVRGKNDGLKWPKESYVDADSFLGRLRIKIGCSDMDLPTEAQWEYACRAGAQSALPNSPDHRNCGVRGEDYERVLPKIAWYGEIGQWRGTGKYDNITFSEIKEDISHTHEVGRKTPNAWGLYDMLGNVAELCLDRYGKYDGDATDPKGSSAATGAVVRGGNYQSVAVSCRSASRCNSVGLSVVLALFVDKTGFRLCCSAGPSE